MKRKKNNVSDRVSLEQWILRVLTILWIAGLSFSFIVMTVIIFTAEPSNAPGIPMPMWLRWVSGGSLVILFVWGIWVIDWQKRKRSD